jgi:broad specificity phosphatase PhoE
MRRLTLIRHGLTEWNVSGRFQGHSDVPLSAEGRAQAEQLSSYLASFPPFDVVMSSPSARAVETARLALPDREPLLDARLRELHFGAFEGLTRDLIERDPRWSVWVEDPFMRPAPGGESYHQLRRRMVEWLAEARDRYPDAHLVAITHSGSIQTLLSALLGVERPRWRKRLYVRHTGVSHVLFRGEEAIVERVNDTRHLVADGEDPFAE